MKFFVEEYFNKTYKGEYPPVKTNAVNSAKNVLQLKPGESNLDSGLFHAKIDALVEKYASKDLWSWRKIFIRIHLVSQITFQAFKKP